MAAQTSARSDSSMTATRSTRARRASGSHYSGSMGRSCLGSASEPPLRYEAPSQSWPRSPQSSQRGLRARQTERPCITRFTCSEYR